MQAFLITAYKDQEQLVKLIKSLNEHAYVFVHIDRRSETVSIDEIRAMKLQNTFVFNKYRIGWGTYTHLLAILDMMKMALAKPDVHYIHTISAQDMRIVTWKELEERFADNNHIYMTCTNAEDIPKKTRERFVKRIVTSRGTTRRYIKGVVRRMNNLYRNLQDRFDLSWNDIKPFKEIYKGMIWCSMPRNAALYAMKYAGRGCTFMRTLKHVTLPEEFFFQTIFWNSEFRGNIVNDNLRYTDWVKRHGSRPAILDETDIDKIKESDCIFARKIDVNVSSKLIPIIEAYVK